MSEVSKSFHSKAEQYRVRAQQLTTISAQFQDDRTKATLQNLAREYLKMADQMAQLDEVETRLESQKAGPQPAQAHRSRT